MAERRVLVTRVCDARGQEKNKNSIANSKKTMHNRRDAQRRVETQTHQLSANEGPKGGAAHTRVLQCKAGEARRRRGGGFKAEGVGGVECLPEGSYGQLLAWSNSCAGCGNVSASARSVLAGAEREATWNARQVGTQDAVQGEARAFAALH